MKRKQNDAIIDAVVEELVTCVARGLYAVAATLCWTVAAAALIRASKGVLWAYALCVVVIAGWYPALPSFFIFRIENGVVPTFFGRRKNAGEKMSHFRGRMNGCEARCASPPT